MGGGQTAPGPSGMGSGLVPCLSANACRPRGSEREGVGGGAATEGQTRGWGGRGLQLRARVGVDGGPVALDAHHHVGELDDRRHVALAAGADDDLHVLEDLAQVGAREAVRLAQHLRPLLLVEVERPLQLTEEELEHLAARGGVGQADVHADLEAAQHVLVDVLGLPQARRV